MVEVGGSKFICKIGSFLSYYRLQGGSLCARKTVGPKKDQVRDEYRMIHNGKFGESARRSKYTRHALPSS
jgi:hypothetical protein